MRTLSIFFIFAFFLVTPFSSSAQILRKIKDAANRGVSRAVEKKVETEAEKMAMRQMEKVFRDMYPEDSVSGMDFGKILSGIKADVEVEPSYSFTGYSLMEITGKDEKGRDIDPVQIKSFFSTNEAFMGMEIENPEKKKGEGNSVMIYDFNRNATIILIESEGQRSRMAYGFDFEKMSAGLPEGTLADTTALEDYSFKKTGRSKVILGHSCAEYQMENEDGTADFWITEKPVHGTTAFWGGKNPYLTKRMKSQNDRYFKDLPEGNMLEMHFLSKKDKTVSTMKVLALDDNAPLVFNMDEYPSVFGSAYQ
ncbi:hypothetical protein P872_24330 [Rhodonellum psychrophilum GCM71 = DSM 17998]|uniref:DUF4412 domain-containing protein n=2 Tax=Rhodonellum TaxID=336827 RepID=U5C411_9BACT|nr:MULTISPECIES: DUF4412 domain-containing protein [Rhodonellum]ERM84549.1 hypothetical protein P872_24330 [Rhodonellum psychrophilum GCM71 = DSM 17998]SDY84920.1 protein of unknown function [Rhodonellum ikkaensis]